MICRPVPADLLALLGLLQSRTMWSGAELAERLEVSGRTVRKDIERLRQLDYPVEAVRGPGGYYRLGIGAKLPPLLLDEEAVAVAVGLRAITGVKGVEETSVRAWSSWRPCSPIGFSCRSTPYGKRCKPDPRTPAPTHLTP